MANIPNSAPDVITGDLAATDAAKGAESLVSSVMGS
jgi:hypothetical protein